ncbi:hypothetical protein MST22_05115 [Virgibacillus halodenitrificans]|uniref:hypothetical protein n=1 Tax=Virgibacillus halodenitrificans TaxID=1482 RepID=UPI001FB38062|nr:hypothetical protein [Virgibacillus halodenitrificans]MCJ0930529.1 hypothetical protein [Virgibacillus halodenitrificans]
MLQKRSLEPKSQKQTRATAPSVIAYRMTLQPIGMRRPPLKKMRLLLISIISLALEV